MGGEAALIFLLNAPFLFTALIHPSLILSVSMRYVSIYQGRGGNGQWCEKREIHKKKKSNFIKPAGVYRQKRQNFNHKSNNHEIYRMCRFGEVAEGISLGPSVH